MILALDPGLEYFGWAVLHPSTARVVALGVIETSRNPRLDVAVDRVVRTAEQSRRLADVVRGRGIETIAAEAISLGGAPAARVTMAMCLGLSWGSICAVARAANADLFALPPKQWQHAITPDAVVTTLTKKGKPKVSIDYDRLYGALRRYVNAGQCEDQLDAIPHGKRNHAVDAVGIGMFNVFCRAQCSRVIEAS